MTESSLADVVGRLLVFMVALPGLAFWMRRRFASNQGRTGEGLKVMSRVGLTRNASVAVVALAGRRYLIGIGEHQVTLLTDLPEEAPVATGDADDMVGRTPSTKKDFTERPRMGAVRRLQHMTMRRPTTRRSPLRAPHH